MKQIKITPEKYLKITEKIIEKYKHLPVQETLINLLEEVSKYIIAGKIKRRKKKCLKN
jgi:hypothetical protein